MSDEAQGVKRYRLAFLWLLAFATVFRLWFATTLPLSGDEAYHWEWSRRPALGYYDHPPLTAYAIWMGAAVTGRSTELSVRLGAILLLAGTALLVYSLARLIALERGHDAQTAERAGFMGGFFAIFAPIMAVFSVYMSTDPPLIFFWALALLMFYKAVSGGGARFWMCAGLAGGLAAMSKFLALFLFIGVGLFLLSSRERRRWLLTPMPYMAAVCAIAVLSPFIYWNYHHDWATFRFNLVARQPDASFSVLMVLEYLLSQLLIPLTPGLFVLAAAGAALGFRRREENAKKSGALLVALTFLVPFAYFLAVSFRRRVGLHWPAGGWVGALVLAAVFWVECRGRWAGFRKASLVFCVLITVLAHAVAHTPPSWIEGDLAYPLNERRIRLKVHVERFGWRELGRAVSDMRREMLETGSEAVFVICGQYGLAASVAFYTPDKIKTHLWAPERAHGENYRFWEEFEVLEGADAIYVAKTRYRAELALKSLENGFSRVGPVKRFVVTVNGNEIRDFFFVMCHGFGGDPPDF